MPRNDIEIPRSVNLSFNDEAEDILTAPVKGELSLIENECHRLFLFLLQGKLITKQPTVGTRDITGRYRTLRPREK
jgi:hypothetical protein